MQQNIPAVLQVMQYIYDNIMYAELNTKSDYCQCCGYDGEIKIVENADGKLIWQCPNCGNTDQDKMNVARRTCGYIGASIGTRAVPRRSRTGSCTYKMNYAEIKKMTLQTERACAPLCLFPAVAIGAKTALTPSPGTFCTASPLTKRWRTISLRPPVPAGSAALSLLGGEPFEPENQAPLLAFLRRFRTALPGKTVWCYTGFTLEELLGKKRRMPRLHPPYPGVAGTDRHIGGRPICGRTGRYYPGLSRVQKPACAGPTRYPYDRRAGAVFGIKRLVFKSV